MGKASSITLMLSPIKFSGRKGLALECARELKCFPLPQFCRVCCLYRITAKVPILVFVAYDWESLPQDALVVDVVGGVGSVSLALTRSYKNMKIVVQDQPSVVQDGLKVRALNDLLTYLNQHDRSSGNMKCQKHWHLAVSRLKVWSGWDSSNCCLI